MKNLNFFYKKIQFSEILTSLGIFFIGFLIGYFLFKYQKIFNGYLFLFLLFLTYIFIGIGFYGILKFLLIKLIKAIWYFVKLIIKGKIIFGFNGNRFYISINTE